MAFNLPFSKYKYVRVPFGLAQSPACFQELMTEILKDLDFAIAYLDDKIIPVGQPKNIYLTSNKSLRCYELQNSMKLSKCHFFLKEIQYLGHILSTKVIQLLPLKMQAI